MRFHPAILANPAFQNRSKCCFAMAVLEELVVQGKGIWDGQTKKPGVSLRGPVLFRSEAIQ